MGPEARNWPVVRSSVPVRSTSTVARLVVIVSGPAKLMPVSVAPVTVNAAAVIPCSSPASASWARVRT